MTSTVWQSWDGTCLRWRVDPAVAASDHVQLWLDGVLFERAPMAEFGQREFALAPAGHPRMLFSLRTAHGVVLAPAWRVHYGEPAEVGCDVWNGDVAELSPLAGCPLPSTRALAHAPGVSIVVPIHNSAKLVRACIDSVRRWSSRLPRLILIDDASQEPEIDVLLRECESHPDIVVLRNAENQGYTRSCNRGIEVAGNDDIVLLNADTEVGPRWLQRLRQIAYSDESIGSVTAVSDNAGAFSVPELETYCPIPSCWSLTQTQRALLHDAGGCLPELPSGNGFCMYIKRAVFDRVGLLDADAFPQGYGEENDLCQRAEREGFRHVIAGDVFVRHVRSASFGEARRTALGVTGMQVLRARYPDYEKKVGDTLYSFQRRVLDYRVRRIYAAADAMRDGRAPRPRVLIGVADPARGAVISAAVREQYQAFILEVNESRMRLSDEAAVSQSVHEETGHAGDAGELLLRWLVEHAFELIHLDSPLAALKRTADELAIPVLDMTGESLEYPVAGPSGPEAAEAVALRIRSGLMSRYQQVMNEGTSFG